MSRGDVLMWLGLALCAVGAGLWIHPGAGLLVAGAGSFAEGWLEERLSAGETAPSAESAEAEA